MERVMSVTSAESTVPELALPEPISKFETDMPDHEALGARTAPAHAQLVARSVDLLAQPV